MLNSQSALLRAGFDEIALKPREVDLSELSSLPADRVTVDYEGPGAVPSPATLDKLAGLATLRVTIPVRANGFDPLGDDRRWGLLPADAGVALVAGNPAYLTTEASHRRIAPRLDAALERAPNAWVGTEGIEQIALATGATQFELLAANTEQRVQAIRATDFKGDFAVYSPTVLVDDDDTLLDALGPYVARRRDVADTFPSGSATDASVTGQARDVLLDACEDYAIAGGLESIRRRISRLRDVGVDHVVGYPPRGLDEFRETTGYDS